MSALLKMRDEAEKKKAEADALKPVETTTVRCSHCSTPLSIPVADLGKVRKCPVCKFSFVPKSLGTRSRRKTFSAEESALIAQIEGMGSVGCAAMALVCLFEGPLAIWIVRGMLMSHVSRYAVRAMMRIQNGESTSAICEEIQSCRNSMGWAWTKALLFGALSDILMVVFFLLISGSM